MTTKRKAKVDTTTEVRSVNPPPLYNIQYPNSRRGMFSLRAPFKNSYENQSQQEIFTRTVTPDVVHPKYLHADQNQQVPSYDYQPSQRDAEVQCSLIAPDEGLLARKQQTIVTDHHNRGYLSPRYRVQLQLQPTQPNIYEVWNVETPPRRSIPVHEPPRRRERSIRVRSPHLVSIKSLSDDESDYDSDEYDEYVLCTPYSPRPYFQAPVRMVHVRQDASTICY